MEPLGLDTSAPSIDGIDLSEGPTLLWFYKVTCPVCQMAAAPAQRLAAAYPVPMRTIGQDPPDRLASFGREFGLAVPPVSDPPPYPASVAYGIRVVPTLFVIEPGALVSDVVESWDRDGYNRVSEGLAGRLGMPFVPVSEAGDGLPSFRPG